MKPSEFAAPSPEVVQFLDEYDGLSSGSTAVSAVFADSFLVLDANGSYNLTPTMLVAAIPARRKIFESAGVTRVVRVNAREIVMDPMHRRVAVEWSAETRTGAALLSSSFVLRQQDVRLRAVVYVNHIDPRLALEQTVTTPS